MALIIIKEKYMKLKGKHSSLKLVLLLSTVSLATVGFSAWIINGSISSGNTEISFSVGEVVNNSITVNITDTTNNSIAFDSNVDGGTGIFKGDGNNEDMDFSVEYTVTSGIAFKTTSGHVKVSYTYSSDFTAIKNLNNSNGKQFIDTSCLDVTNYILDGTTTSFEDGAIDVRYDSTTKATVTHTWTFKWGSAFNNNNPCNITSDIDGTYKGNLNAFVEAAKTAMTDKTFTITITPSFAA